MDVFAKGYNDYLQNPLQVMCCLNVLSTSAMYYSLNFMFFQPLMDNLDSHTYEVFEKDPVKYKEYEEVYYIVFVCLELEIILNV